ncbi:Hypothetical protein Tpal_1087 [Trichococcus palustris]|uniref:Uncharacterized protein n=1 Tax=Trichococcus palustris TaxID=140314 RepID=A0A143YHJ3_9LACT|nr:hypothetical protein [Trichococcus palustris]CZQ89060.1 Hypothetical protein Tpal_1087 [Trichococcus palustris]SFL00196.1 hypothetical protein SAMN04488076_1139 [Trichococcus palustris]
MELMNKIKKYDNEEFLLFDWAQKQLEKTGDVREKEDWLMQSYGFSEDHCYTERSERHLILDDINTMKDIIAYAEINRYRETLLSEMSEEEKETVIPRIIDSLSELYAPPTAYAIKKDAIVLAWYLNNVANVWSLTEDLQAITRF